MSFEKYTKFFDGEPDGKTVRIKGIAEFSFSAVPQENTAYRLFTVGESEQYYMYKDEPDGPLLYRSLSDSLNTEHAVHDAFCLDFSSRRSEDFIRRTYKKVMWPPVLSYLMMSPVPTLWKTGITVSGENVTVEEDGFLQMRVDIRLKKENVNPHSTAGKPDYSIIIPFPCGTYAPVRLEKEIDIPQNTAHVGVFVEGKKYTGKVWCEMPFLTGDSQNLLPPFAPHDETGEKFMWTSQYLSRREWPEFCVKLNGETVFSGEVFERSHRHSEWEIPLPAHLIKENNTLSYELISDYREPLPYTFYEIGLIEQPSADISLISVQQISHAGGKLRVMIKTMHENTRVTLSECDSALSGEREYFFEESGLHGILLDCLYPALSQKFTLSTESTAVQGVAERIAVKNDDGVITGSGDMIYICADDDSMEEYLSWYVSNGVGDLVTIRPAYRWSGTRCLNKPLWRRFCKLMDELDMKWVVIADGRELPGISAQPSDEDMAGRGYLGRQDHECDGAEFYWGQKKADSFYTEQWLDMAHFAWQEDREHVRGAFSESEYIYKDNEIYYRSDRNRPKDNALCRSAVVGHIDAARSLGARRHTGPASVFKYMYEAGYTWLGAETMYSTMELTLGFLRGFAKDKSMTSWGVHHAVQWSSTPNDASEHFKRFKLALYASYILGATDINTEEGFWHMEEGYEHHHRFSHACKEHLACQQEFFRYVCSHTRSGEFYTPFALISGRDDGIDMSAIGKNWGMEGEKTPAERSWELVKALYPQSKPATLMTYHNCPTDRAVGFHTSTPYGSCDMIPAESRTETVQSYRSLIFMGYNRMTEDDERKFFHCLKNGASVLMTRAHLTKTSDFASIKQGNLEFDNSCLSFTESNPVFVSDTFNGNPVFVCDNPLPADEVLLYTDSHRPLLCRYRVGKGELYLFSVREYPSCPAISEYYEKMMINLAEKAGKEEYVWAKTGEDSEFAVYVQPDGTRHVYFLAVDWWQDSEKLRTAYLKIGNEEYRVQMPFGTVVKCVCNENLAVWTADGEGEVLSLSQKCVRVQGSGTVVFTVAKNGSQENIEVDFSSSPVKEFALN